MTWDSRKKTMIIDTFCLNCTKFLGDDTTEKQTLLKSLLLKFSKVKHPRFVSAAFEVFQNLKGSLYALDELVQRIVLLFKHDNQQVKIALIEALNSFSHVKSFYTIEITKLWLTFAMDDNKEIRKEFSLVVSLLVEKAQVNT